MQEIERSGRKKEQCKIPNLKFILEYLKMDDSVVLHLDSIFKSDYDSFILKIPLNLKMSERKFPRLV